jgi:hypothetical protein
MRTHEKMWTFMIDVWPAKEAFGAPALSRAMSIH